mgnify:CR=1 FL=1
MPTTVLARTSGNAASLVAAMQRELRILDVTLPVITAMTMAPFAGGVLTTSAIDFTIGMFSPYEVPIPAVNTNPSRPPSAAVSRNIWPCT